MIAEPRVIDLESVKQKQQVDRTHTECIEVGAAF